MDFLPVQRGYRIVVTNLDDAGVRGQLVHVRLVDALNADLVHGSSGGLKVHVVAGGGAGGGGTEYIEDDAAPANPSGGALVARRRDALATETTADGDITALNCTGKGELFVKHADPITVTGVALDATLQAVRDRLPAALDASGGLKVAVVAGGGSGGLTNSELRAAPVDVAVTSLPAGLATGAKQDTGNASLASVDGKLATAKIADLDTGAGTDNVQIVGLALPKAGGAVAGGTASDPLRTDPTGTTVQPISAAALPLPAGAATSAKQDTMIGALASIDTNVADVEAAIATTQPRDVTDRAARLLGHVSVDASALPTGAALDASVIAVRDRLPAALEGGRLPVATLPASTATIASVYAQRASVSLLPANAARRGAIVKNDSPYRMFVAYASSTSPSSFTDWIDPGATWTMPGIVYTGPISAAWCVMSSDDPVGQALVTEIV